MSAETPQAANPQQENQEPSLTPEEKAFTEQFGKDLEAAIQTLADKYSSMVLDFAITVNWTPENHQKPYPKLIVQTLRDPKTTPFDPVRQAMEISDLLNLGGVHVIRQALGRVLQQNSALRNEVQKLANSEAQSKIIVPGQGQPPPK